MSTIVWDRTAHGGGHGHCTPWLNFLLFCASGSHESVNLPVELSTNCSQPPALRLYLYLSPPLCLELI